MQPNECQTCGNTLPPDAPSGLCPHCLLKVGLAESAAHVFGDEATLAGKAEHDGNSLEGAATESQLSEANTRRLAGTKIRYFGDYELLEEIARGGMGVVFRARQTRLNRIVALKMILSGRLASETDVRRFQTEAEAAAQLDHPGIVPIYEVGEHDGHHFYSMALVEGVSLAERMSGQPLPAAEAAKLLQTVADTVAYAHEKGVIHRDLKPSNILIDSSGNPRVADFGLAKKTGDESSLTQSGQMLGTPSFMAPEQASGKSEQVSVGADIYSLGAILFCVLTGRPPFVADSAAKTLWKLTHDEPPLPRKLNANIPADLEAICLKCLEKDPARRYQSAADLHDDLTRFLNHQSIQARRPTIASRTLRWCRRNRRSIAAMVVTSAIVLLAVVGVQRGKQWYNDFRTGKLAINVASGPTEIAIYRDGNPIPERSLTIATDEKIDLRYGDYEIWAKRYGQRWKASILPRQMLELELQDEDYHESPLRTAYYLAYSDPNRNALIRREGRVDFLADTGYPSSAQQRTIELHHGWSGDRLWALEIPSSDNEQEGMSASSSDQLFLEIPGGKVTSDFDNDGVDDIAMLKASRYIVASTGSGEVLLEQSIALEKKYKGDRVSFGEFVDINQDNTLDLVLRVRSDVFAFDGRNGHLLWKTEVGFGSALQIVTAKVEPFLLATTLPKKRESKGKIQIYRLLDGTVASETEAGESHLELLGILKGDTTPLLLLSIDTQLEALTIPSGQKVWNVSMEDYKLNFSLRSGINNWQDSIVLEDLTGDGITDALLASRPIYGDPSIEFMMVDGQQGSIVWRSKIPIVRPFSYSIPAAVYGEPASVAGNPGKLYFVEFEKVTDKTQPEAFLHCFDPKNGHIGWKSKLPIPPYSAGFWFHQSLDGSSLPDLVIESGGDIYKRHLLTVDKETGAALRQISVDRSTPLLTLADINLDGLADFLTGEYPRASNTGGIPRFDVWCWTGKPRVCWRRPGESFPLADLDKDGVGDVLILGQESIAVSGLTGEVIHRFPSLPQEPFRTDVTNGSFSDGNHRIIVQVSEEGFQELDTHVGVIDANSGQVVAEIDDRLEGRWGPDVGSSSWTNLLFPDLDADGQPEIAVTGNKPWRIYSIKDRKRLAVGSRLGNNADLFQNPNGLVGYFTGKDGRDRLIEVGSIGQLNKTVTIRSLGQQGHAEWSTQLPLREQSKSTPTTTGVTLEDFDNDGEADLILWWDFNLWVVDPSTGELKQHAWRNGQITSNQAIMVRTSDGDSALAVPFRTLIAIDGETTHGAYQDVMRSSNPGTEENVFVWIEDDGRIVAYESDGVSKLWEAHLPDLPTTTSPGNFMHETDWNGAVVARKGDELFAMDLLSGRKLWRSSVPGDHDNRLFLLTRENHSTPMIVSTNEKMTICREAYPVDEQWNYQLPVTQTVKLDTPTQRN